MTAERQSVRSVWLVERKKTGKLVRELFTSKEACDRFAEAWCYSEPEFGVVEFRRVEGQ